MSNFSMMSSLDESSDSFSRMQQHYWTTKQAVFQKLGKKEDDCIIASDMGLDLKLELFQNIEESFLTLMRVLESYQDKLCALAQEENVLGRFLKEHSKHDKTKAGKAMCNAGKALSYSAQQRLTLRVPLIRLYQEVETFQYRAIVDTLQTIDKMEKARTSYRGTLMWMKDVSQQLDPDTCKQLAKFKKVQNKVRRAKYMFDNLKLDTLQKIDLLSFSRCNLFSQALSSYQASLLNLSKRVAHISNSVAEMTKGYQHYEFSMLKELTETSKKLAEESFDQKPLPGDDKDTILFFEAEYHDDIDSKSTEELQNAVAHGNYFSDTVSNYCQNGTTELEENCENIDDKETHKSAELLHLEENNYPNKDDNAMKTADKCFANFNLQSEINNERICSSEANGSAIPIEKLDYDQFTTDWPSIFDDNSLMQSVSKVQENVEDSASTRLSFLPSELLNMSFSTDVSANLQQEESNEKKSGTEETKTLYETKKCKQDMSAWFNLFADLDPLANPDLIGRKKNSTDDRNC